MRVVLDTNVVVSAVLTPKGRPAEVLSAVLRGDLVLLFDARIVAEYREVLTRPKFSLDRDRVMELVSDLETLGRMIDVGSPAPGTTTVDPKDKPFIEVAIVGRADAIVTGNVRHFPGDLGIEILSPAEMASRLERAGEST